LRKILISSLLLIVITACGHKAPPPGKPDISPPEITIIFPKNGDTLSMDTVRVEVEVKDSSAIKEYILIIDGMRRVTTEDTDSLFFTTDSLVDTLPHTLSVRASDVWDNWGTSPPVKFFIKR